MKIGLKQKVMWSLVHFRSLIHLGAAVGLGALRLVGNRCRKEAVGKSPGERWLGHEGGKVRRI